MKSVLIVSSVENLQGKINEAVRTLQDIPGVYVSLNKTQKSVEDILKSRGIHTEKLFFIDCVTSEQKRTDVLHIAPQDLETLNAAIHSFVRELKGERFIVIDALSTLLIYNNENKVAQFVKEITEYSSEEDVRVIAFSPKTRGEELLNKIFNFFDEVRK